MNSKFSIWVSICSLLWLSMSWRTQLWLICNFCCECISPWCEFGMVPWSIAQNFKVGWSTLEGILNSGNWSLWKSSAQKDASGSEFEHETARWRSRKKHHISHEFPVAAPWPLIEGLFALHSRAVTLHRSLCNTAATSVLFKDCHGFSKLGLIPWAWDLLELGWTVHRGW